MSPISIILHVGTVIKSLRDIEKGVADAISGHPSKDDLKAVIQDVLSLVQSGVISFPGFTEAQLQQALTDLENSI